MTANTLDNIEHIVVLMMENRSFDNVLGWLYNSDNLPPGETFNGVNSSMSNPERKKRQAFCQSDHRRCSSACLRSNLR